MGKLKKIAGLLKEKGIKETLSHILKYLKANAFNYSLETYAVFKTALDKPIPVIKPRLELEIYKLQNNGHDIDEIISIWPDYFGPSKTDAGLKKVITYYFNCGDECFCVKHNNKIVGMAWVGYQHNYMLKSMAQKIGLTKDEVILHRGFVNEEVRGNRIYGFLLTSVSNYVRDKGYKKWLAYVGAKNIASLGVHSRICDEYRLIHHLQITVCGIILNIFPEYDQKSEWFKCNNYNV